RDPRLRGGGRNRLLRPDLSAAVELPGGRLGPARADRARDGGRLRVVATPGPARLTTEKETAPGELPRGRRFCFSATYFLRSSIAALALSAATDDLPALHAASASLTRVEAFLNSAERGDWMSWLRGDWMSWLRGDWMFWLRGDWMSWLRGDWMSWLRGDCTSWLRGDWMFWLRGDWMSCPRGACTSWLRGD